MPHRIRLIVLGGIFLLTPQGFSQAPTLATPANRVEVRPTLSPSNTPAPTPICYELDLPITVEVAGHIVKVTEISAEQALLLLQREKENTDAKRRYKLQWWGVVGAIAALLLLTWRTYTFSAQTREQMLASYRERLFSDSPSACIAAAMSLSKYPREAIWLVMRWAEEHQKEAAKNRNESTDSDQATSDPYQVKQAMEDALANMGNRASWAFLGWRRPRWPRKWRRHRFLRFPLWNRVKGPRLERSTISIDIGPIHLPNAYMRDGIFESIGLQGAYLPKADLRCARLKQAKLKGIRLLEANLQGALLEYANLQEANLWFANLEDAWLRCANLQDANLCRASLQGARLDEARLQNAEIVGANLRQAELAMTQLQNADLAHANVEKANLVNAHLNKAHLVSAQLQGADLQMADFDKANLQAANLEHAILAEANLRTAELAGARFKNAKLGTSPGNVGPTFMKTSYLSYATAQDAILDDSQKELVHKWNDSHPDAPWLQQGWEFWWQKTPKSAPGDEIDTVRDYIDNPIEAER